MTGIPPKLYTQITELMESFHANYVLTYSTLRLK